MVGTDGPRLMANATAGSTMSKIGSVLSKAPLVATQTDSSRDDALAAAYADADATAADGPTQWSRMTAMVEGSQSVGERACFSPDLAASDINASRDRERRVWDVLEAVPDPEIPVLTIVDLGIVRHVRWLATADGQAQLRVGITPTYSGCPATEVIRGMIATALECNGFAGAIIEEVLSPPWTSDWLTDAGRRKLEVFGIAPPERSVSNPRHLFRAPAIACPRCGSKATEKISEFGSTPCKAHYRCTACLEPFDYFKCI